MAAMCNRCAPLVELQLSQVKLYMSTMFPVCYDYSYYTDDGYFKIAQGNFQHEPAVFRNSAQDMTD